MNRDQIYAQGSEGQPFEFSEKVAGVFEDMIRRSVPGYGPLGENVAKVR